MCQVCIIHLVCTQYFLILGDDLILIPNLRNSSETIHSNIHLLPEVFPSKGGLAQRWGADFLHS